MKAYKIEVLVIDHKDLGASVIQTLLESNRYISPYVQRVTAADIGEWSDDHPLNRFDLMVAEYARLFGGAS